MSKEKILVIVESPAKSKTIEKYLGPDYVVSSSMGHLRDLPKSKLGVDVEAGFEPEYIAVKGKTAIIADLKKKASGASKVYLATDPDREGEAIAWHLKELLSISDEKAFRVSFNEITKKVVSESIKNPRDIDIDLVNAQQARRILDRLVGYELSPLLWKKIRRGLSAGRVQSVASRIVVDKEEEIRAFKAEEYWTIDAELYKDENTETLLAKFYGDENGKIELKNEEESRKVKEAVENSPFIIKQIESSKKNRSAAPPFITSSLQQEASRRLGMTPRRTMVIAQQLYEGVNIVGKGSIGLITYMRTDSLRISEQALSDVAAYIKSNFEEDYYYGKPRRFKAKKDAQDAHEAIRPTDVFLSPVSIKSSLSSDQFRLYRLIWSRFLASQMSNAVYDTLKIRINSGGYIFNLNASVMSFKGFTAAYEFGPEEEEEDIKKSLPQLGEGEELKLKKLDVQQRFTQPPARYTEATLIREMEENGIGRPSTYAPTISTILSHEYVVKEGKYLKPTVLGETVTNMMKEHFPEIVSTAFTAGMEEGLDDIEEGKKSWKDFLSEFYQEFSEDLKNAENIPRIKIPEEVTEEVCPKCGKNLVIKFGRFGRFLACPGFPDCDFTMPLIETMPGSCPKCGGRILKRKSKKGYTFYSCENGSKRKEGSENSDEFVPECDFITWDVPTEDNCPECGWTMFKKSGRGAKKSFCMNPECSLFVPEEKRGGYYKKTSKSAKTKAAASGDKKTVKKTAKNTKGSK